MSLHAIRLTHGVVSSLPGPPSTCAKIPPPSILIRLSILFINRLHLLSCLFISIPFLDTQVLPSSSHSIGKMARLRPSSNHNFVGQFFPTQTPFLQQPPSPLFARTHISL